MTAAPTSSPFETTGAWMNAGQFVRGDSDLSGSVNLGDAVVTFSHLFAGGGPLPCEDAVDADDDGGLTLSDGVFLLGHLFVDGPPPPPPFPDPGYDPTEDGLGCRP